MYRAFVITAAILLSPLPAFSQNAPAGEGRDTSYSQRDRDTDEILGALREHRREGFRRGGASFVLRHGDSTVAVRCDPQDSMKACVDATLTLLDHARSMAPSGAAPGGAPGAQPPSH